MSEPASGHGQRPSASPAAAGQSVNGWSSDYIEQLYEAWKADPGSVDASWNQLFLGFDLGLARSAEGAAHPAAAAPPAAGAEDGAQSRVDALIEGYRRLGHLAADLDPLGTQRPFPKELELASFGLSDADLARVFATGTLPIGARATLADIVAFLRKAYCGSVGAEFGFISCPAKRAWLQERLENLAARTVVGSEAKQRILSKLVLADGLENFLATRYIGKKRFGLEGGESLLVLIDGMFTTAARAGAEECVMGMAHRGRVNVLHNVAGKSAEMLFTEFDESWHAAFEHGGGDVKYHQGFSGVYILPDSGSMRVSLCANPSHLEFVAGVCTGRARARQEHAPGGLEEGRKRILPLLIHGDAALPGQGVVAEVLNMCGLDGYDVGGTLHIVINNQVGFTTDSADSYAGPYCTNVARIVEAPVMHVNGGDAEACAFVAKLAAEWRTTFHEDFFVDMWCWRKNGHNETDEPNFTQPLLYQRVRAAKPVMQRYADQLVAEGVIEPDAADLEMRALFNSLDAAQQRARTTPVFPGHEPFAGAWAGLTSACTQEPVATGVPLKTLKALAKQLGALPEGFNAHKTVAKGVQSRVALDGPVDWALAELLAYGSLVLEGDSVRITGQDVKRGTFSHRHAAAVDQQTGEQYIALRHLSGAKGRFEIHNSPLTECACVGFEYGFSLVDPKWLVIWEAQFGDFANGAQVLFDQFIAAAEAKWFRCSGLTLFLPHGYEGQGPEHSSARMERFLALAAQDNLQVVYPTTTAQVFHVLRRQVKRNFRKPLVVMTPKSMLRLPAAQSPVQEFVDGQFQTVIPDPARPEASGVTRIVFCTGKLFHELDAQRKANGNATVALVRIEQPYPFPADEVAAQLARYRKAEAVWVQEEPQNAGAWSFMLEQFLERFDRRLKYIGRPPQASPAVGSLKAHVVEQARLVAEAVGPAPDAAKEKPGAGTKAAAAH
ncbi:MAG: 2-oxoglutarate dehydrogenase E1 component [Phycisphaerales bacterium]